MRVAIRGKGRGEKNIQPGNELGLFWETPQAHVLIYLLRTHTGKSD